MAVKDVPAQAKRSFSNACPLLLSLSFQSGWKPPAEVSVTAPVGWLACQSSLEMPQRHGTHRTQPVLLTQAKLIYQEQQSQSPCQNTWEKQFKGGKERFILAHGCRCFSPWAAGSVAFRLVLRQNCYGGSRWRAELLMLWLPWSRGRKAWDSGFPSFFSMF